MSVSRLVRIDANVTLKKRWAGEDVGEGVNAIAFYPFSQSGDRLKESGAILTTRHRQKRVVTFRSDLPRQILSPPGGNLLKLELPSLSLEDAEMCPASQLQAPVMWGETFVY